MAYRRIVAGSTSQLIEFPVYNSSSTTGGLLTGLAYNTSGLTAYYYREGAAGSISMSLATMTLGTWASLGFVAVDGTNMPGIYQLGIPNAAIATGSGMVTIYLQGATNMVPVVITIELTSVTDYPANVTQLLGTAWLTPGTAGTPDVNVKLIGGQSAGLDANNLLKVDVADWLGTAVSAATAGIPDVNTKNIANAAVSTATAQIGVNAVNIAGQAAALDGNNLLKVDVVDIAGAAVSTTTAQLGVNAVQIGAAVPGSATIGTVTNLTNAPTSGDLTATMKTSVGTAVYNQLNTAIPGCPTGGAGQATAGSIFDYIQALKWTLVNKMAITDANGNTVIYQDDDATTAWSISGMFTDNSTVTTRLRTE
jgi:hypothetical protein